MIRMTRLMAFAFGVGLAAAGMAVGQTQSNQSDSTAKPAQPPPWDRSATPKAADSNTVQPNDPNSNQPTYAVDPPPATSSGVYLPAAVLGYGKSVAGCVIAGCDDGPKASGASTPSTSAPAGPPPPSPGQTDSH
ncbi:MAG TPA: hypothetical protein VGI95_08040 [Caulobacteraceae bacterium]|jgi:hypothetical protein